MKKATAFFLALVLCLSMVTVNAQTNYSGSENFKNIIGNVTYNDVSYLPVNHWSIDAIYLMSALGVIKGTGGDFNYSGNLSKSEGLALAFRIAGLEETAESYRKLAVKNKETAPEKYNNIDSWADGYLRVAVDKNIMTVEEYNNEISADYTNATFKRTEAVTKGDFVIWLVKALNFEIPENLNYVLDYPELNEYSEEEKYLFEVAIKSNILKGDGVSLGVQSYLTREQAAQLLFNISDICVEKLGIKIISGTVDKIETNTEVFEDKAIVTKEIFVGDSSFVTSKMYKMNGEAVDSSVSFDKEYKDIITLASKQLPSSSEALAQADNVKCYVKGDRVLCITKFENKETEIKHNDEDYNDSLAYSGTLYFVDTDERSVVLINDTGEYVEIPYLSDAVFCNRNTILTPEELNAKWTDCPVYVFTIVKKTGGLSRAYRVQVVTK